MGEITVVVERLDGTVLLRPSGELDLATAPELQRVLDGVIGRHAGLAVDLSDVTFADCAGLAPIRRALRAGTHGSTVRLFAARPPVERVLHLTGLGRPAGRSADPAGASPG